MSDGIDEAIAAIAENTSLSRDDATDLLACSVSDLELLVQTYKDLGKMPGPSAWAIVIDILTPIATLAGLVTGISGAVGAVYGLAAAK
jgi:NADPH-dependent curcumin reductase CurA